MKFCVSRLLASILPLGLAWAGWADLGHPMAAAPTDEGVPAVRLAALSRGVNLGNWFSQSPGGASYRHAWLQSWIGTADFAALKQAGFRHVRFPVEFEMFLDEDHPSVLRPEFLADFDQALDRILGAGLAVVVDFHAREDTKERLRIDDGAIARFAQLWGAVARHVAGRDPDRVFLETMNEPVGGMPAERWREVQARFFAAMRTAAPNHTVIVTSTAWDGIGELVKLEPVPDRDVVYTFHFYEPMIFTHQGASWTGAENRAVLGLAFPAEAANRAALAERLPDAGLRAPVLAYHATESTLAAQISLADIWARAHRVPLYCGEFGVFTRVAPPDSRYRWLASVRRICDERGIGWAMWDYCGGFRLALGDTAGQRRLDPRCLQALGMDSAAEPSP